MNYGWAPDLRGSGARLIARSRSAWRTRCCNRAPTLTTSRTATTYVRGLANRANSLVAPDETSQKVRGPSTRTRANLRAFESWVTFKARRRTTRHGVVVSHHPTVQSAVEGG